MKNNLLRLVRRSKEMTQEEASSALGLPLRTYSDYENKEERLDSLKYRYLLSSLSEYSPTAFSFDYNLLPYLLASGVGFVFAYPYFGETRIIADKEAFLPGGIKVSVPADVSKEELVHALQNGRIIYRKDEGQSSLVSHPAPINRLTFNGLRVYVDDMALTGMEKLLGKEGKYTYLAYLLSDQNRFLISVIYKGKQRQFKGSLLHLYDELFGFIKMVGGKNAEAIIKAILCFDYEAAGEARVTILPTSFSFDAPARNHPDPLLELLYEQYLNANEGSDNENDNENGRETSLSKPQNAVDNENVITAEKQETIEEKRDNDKVRKPNEEGLKQNSHFEKNPLDELNGKERLVLSEVKKNTHITRNELIEITSIAPATLSRIFKTLKDKEFLRRQGSDKTGYWEVIEK